MTKMASKCCRPIIQRSAVFTDVGYKTAQSSKGLQDYSTKNPSTRYEVSAPYSCSTLRLARLRRDLALGIDHANHRPDASARSAFQNFSTRMEPWHLDSSATIKTQRRETLLGGLNYYRFSNLRSHGNSRVSRPRCTSGARFHPQILVRRLEF